MNSSHLHNMSRTTPLSASTRDTREEWRILCYAAIATARCRTLFM